VKKLASFVSLVAVLQVTGPAFHAVAQEADPTGSSRTTVVRTDRFELRSDPRVGLFHFLIDWASAEAGEWPPYALPIRERDGWRDLLEAPDAHIWADAAAAFDATRGRSLLFDEGILALRDWAAGVGDRASIPAADRPIAEALEAALPVYERYWWPAHEGRNRAWIEAVAPELDDMEEAVIPRLAAAYGGRWPDGAVPVDVVYHANPVGAYSTGGRLTISSADRENQMPQALELVFHEASHTDPLEGPLIDGVEAAFRAAGGEAPERFWHDVIFFTSGEIVRIVFEETNRPAYSHYGETSGVYTRAERWTTELPALEEHWKPFVRSGSGDTGARRAALEAVARALGDPR
jgi:hypothetical protein